MNYVRCRAVTTRPEEVRVSGSARRGVDTAPCSVGNLRSLRAKHDDSVRDRPFEA
jgi:hypothetical protein